jgi:hypothetical protein
MAKLTDVTIKHDDGIDIIELLNIAICEDDVSALHTLFNSVYDITEKGEIDHEDD